jgi:enoyl-CoA hydratase/carnithine racemase
MKRMNSRSRTGEITVRINRGVARISLSNPAQRNALTRQMCIDLMSTVEQLDDDPDVVAICIRGEGGDFCAGASLTELRSILVDQDDSGRLIDHLSRADAAISDAIKPTVALVEGACIGGGWQIASACDFIVASDDATIGITPAKLGIIYPRVAVERLIRSVGPAVAKLLLFTGEGVSARRALECGLVAEVIEARQFDSRADELLDSLIKRSQFSIHTLKRLIGVDTGADSDADSQWEAAWAATVEGPDMGIGIHAFLERREPVFSWAPTSRQTH